MRVYLFRLPPAPHDRADQMGSRSHTVSMTPSWSGSNRVTHWSVAGTNVEWRIVNLRQLERRAGEINQVTRATCLPARTHLAFTSSEHLFDLEPALLLLLKLTLASQRALAGFGCFGCR